MSFRTDRYYVVFPKQALLDLAKKFGLEMLIDKDDGEVWHTYNHSHTGNEQPRAEFEQAFWTNFLGALNFEKQPNPEAAKQFLRECIKMGLPECWNVMELKGGSSATEFVAEVERSKHLAAENLQKIRE